MRCTACKNGVTRMGTVTVSIDRDSTVVVVRGVPAEVCTTCGEEYLDAGVVKEIEIIVDGAQRAGIDVSVQNYSAA